MGFNFQISPNNMDNNELFYEDTSRIPWYEINKSMDSDVLFEESNNVTPYEDNTVDDSVIFVSETNANEDILSHSVTAKRKVNLKHCKISADKRTSLSGKIKRKYKNKTKIKNSYKTSLFKKIADDLEALQENDSEVIILDETNTSQCTERQAPQRQAIFDDSVIFVSETNVDDQFIPFSTRTIDNIEKPLLRSAEKKRRSLNGLLKNNKTETKHKYNELLKIKNKIIGNKKRKILSKSPEKEKKITTIQQDDFVALNKKTNKKRMVLIDGSNVAYKHSNDKFFSVDGLKICLEYFEKKGFDVKAVVPQFRFKRSKTNNAELLEQLKTKGKIIITPSKHLPGKFSCSYDDRCIIQMACEMDAAIVSNDNYCDLIKENDDFKKIIENRVIGYYWCNDLFMLPQDPYGRNGPTLHEILSC